MNCSKILILYLNVAFVVVTLHIGIPFFKITYNHLCTSLDVELLYLLGLSVFFLNVPFRLQEMVGISSQLWKNKLKDEICSYLQYLISNLSKQLVHHKEKRMSKFILQTGIYIFLAINVSALSEHSACA